MLIKLKILIAYLVNIGILPIVVVGLFDFGVLVSDPWSLFAMILLGELFLGTLMLIRIVYKSADKEKKAQEATAES